MIKNSFFSNTQLKKLANILKYDENYHASRGLLYNLCIRNISVEECVKIDRIMDNQPVYMVQMLETMEIAQNQIQNKYKV